MPLPLLFRTPIALLLVAANAVGAEAAGGSVPTPTPSSQQQAEAHFKRGIERFDDAEFELSLVEFQRAYALRPSYHLLFNIGQVHYQLRQYAKARIALDEYLVQGRGDLGSDRRVQVERQLAGLHARTAELHIVVNIAGAEVSINDEPIGTSPLSAAVFVDVGTQRVTASKVGYASARAKVAVAGGDVTSVGLTLQEPTPDAARSSDDLPATLAWVGTGVLATAAIGTGIATLFTSRRYNEMRSEPLTGSPSAARGKLDAQQSLVSTLATSTDVLAGASLAAAGIALYFTVRTPSAADGAPQLGAHAGPQGFYTWLDF